VGYSTVAASALQSGAVVVMELLRTRV